MCESQSNFHGLTSTLPLCYFVQSTQSARQHQDFIHSFFGPLLTLPQELHQKHEAANQKLRQMVLDQQEAGRQKVHSQEVQAQLELQERQIAVKRESAVSELAGVEPAVIEAQQGRFARHCGVVKLRKLGGKAGLTEEIYTSLKIDTTSTRLFCCLKITGQVTKA